MMYIIFTLAAKCRLKICLASIGQLVAEEAHRPAVAGAGTCSLSAGLIDDSMIKCLFIHVQLTITERS